MKLPVLLLLATGCVTSYAREKPMSFSEVPYVSPEGKAWKEDRVPLPEIAVVYRLAEPPEVAYVELNPDGRDTLVFVHGLGSNLKFWRYQLDAFAAQGYRVIALDLLGYGKSDKPATFPYSMEAMADVVRELVRALDVEKPVLVGHSMGGHVSLTYAIRFPDELSALILTSPAGFEEFSVREKAWFRSVFSSALVKGASEETIWGNVRSNNFERWRSEYEWLIEERVRTAKTPEFDQYAYANVKSVHGLTQTDFVRQNLERISVPTLIIYGTRDRLIPNPFLHGGSTDDVMAYGHQRIKRSKLVPLAGCGHMVQMDCSEPYNADVREFLKAASTTTDAVAKDVE
jgi:pimeloyl-ACP methyl ester carboxylesterase